MERLEVRAHTLHKEMEVVQLGQNWVEVWEIEKVGRGWREKALEIALEPCLRLEDNAD